MMTRHHERVVRGQVSSEHLVQLFDDAESLAETVAAFLFEGWQRGEPLVVAARPENWAATSRLLVAQGCPVDEETAAGRIVVLDAATTLAMFVQNGQPIAERFTATVGDVVGTLFAKFGKRLRIYGEMVDILAAQAEFVSAQRLEQLWNDLGSRLSFTLLCGYASGHFGDARTASLLRDICQTHDHACAKPADLLGSWLLAGRQSSYHANE